MAAKPLPGAPSNVVTLPVRPSPAVRTQAVIIDEIRAHAEAMKLLGAELAALEPSAPTQAAAENDEVLSLQRAAFAIGWERQRLLRHIVRHNAAHPHDKIAHQPGGVRNSPWQVPMARLRRYVRDLPAGAG